MKISPREAQVFDGVGRLEKNVHRQLTRYCATVWKPSVSSHSYFSSNVVPLDNVNLLVLRRQWVENSEAALKSTPFMRFGMALTGNNELRLKRVAAYELAITNRRRDIRAYNPESQPVTTEFLLRMDAELRRKVEERNCASSPSAMPSALFVFDRQNMPRFEATTWFQVDALTMANMSEYHEDLKLSFPVPKRVYPDWSIFTQIVGEAQALEFQHAVWMYGQESKSNGQVMMPQEYFIGRPEVKPVGVMVDVSTLLGQEVPSTVPAALQALKLWSEGFDTEDTRVKYASDVLATIKEDDVARVIAKSRDLLGSLGEGISDDEWMKAVAEPQTPITLPRMGRMEVLDIYYPSANTMTVTDRGNVYDMFSGVEDGEDIFIPASPKAWQRRTYRPAPQQKATYAPQFAQPESVLASQVADGSGGGSGDGQSVLVVEESSIA